MKSDIQAAAEKLASDPGLTDYDFWRTLKNLDYEIFQRTSSKPADPLRHAALAAHSQTRALQAHRTRGLRAGGLAETGSRGATGVDWMIAVLVIA